MHPVPRSQLLLLIFLLLSSLLLSSCQSTQVPASCASCSTASPHAVCTSWQIVPSLNPGNVADQLADVFAAGNDNVWAVGSVSDTSTSRDSRTLVEHWDGHAWTVMPTPMPSKPLAGLRQIAAISDHNLWALDSNGVLLHWNGSSWSSASFPNADQNGYSIKRLAAQPDGQLWLVGTVRSPTGPGPRTLIARSC